MLQTNVKTCFEARLSLRFTLEPKRSFSASPSRTYGLLRTASWRSSPQLAPAVHAPTKARLSSSQWQLETVKPPVQRGRSFSTTSHLRSWWRGSSKPAEAKATQSFDSKPIEIPEETEDNVEQLPTRRVHILGLGSIGMLIAHSLQCLPNPPPISLLMHRQSLYDTFIQKGRVVRLLKPNSDINDEQTGFDVDVLRLDGETGAPYWQHYPEQKSNRPINPLQPGEKLDSGEVLIHTLILAVKGPRTKYALQSIKHRINSQTTICLMQNGMGQVEELNREIFTDPANRPTYLLGIVYHGAYTAGPFAVVHAGFGTISLGIYRDTDKYPLPPKSTTFDVSQLSDEERKRMYPTEDELYSNLSSRYLLRTLTRSPVLACAPFPYLDLVQLQLEKLSTNCVINPFTTLLDVPNGSMLDNNSITRAQRLILAEISLVIRNLPELEGVPAVNTRFSTDRLESLCTAMATRTAQNSSSMREDARQFKPTEINYINGYIVRRGEEQGIKCVLNYLLVKLIHAKTEMATESSEYQPHGTSSIESVVSPSGIDPDGVISLEDTGTKLKGKPY